MPQLFRSSFDTDTDGFTGGAWSSAQGSAKLDDADGALVVGAAGAAYRDFTAQTTGKVRVDFWWKDAAATTTTAASSATVVYLMANGVMPTSADSVFSVLLGRATADGATSTETVLAYRGASAFVNLLGNSTSPLPFKRGHWYKVSIVADTVAKTCDLYISDVLFLAGLAWPNASAANVGRVAVVGQASSPDCFVDEVTVTSGWALSESVLVDHTFVGGSGEIEATTPTTSLRETHGQPWLIPENVATYGGFTLGANGAAPDASRLCLALQRCAVDGVIECEFRTPSSGAAYFGIAFRFWDYFTSTSAGGGLLRVSGGATNTAILTLPTRDGTNAEMATTPFTPTADTTYTLRLEMRGRILAASIKAAAIDSGSYTALFTHTIINSATGGRGMLSEELAGPFIATTVGAATNYVRRFRFTGAAIPTEVVKTVGRYKYEVSLGSIRGLYALDAAAPTRNLFWSKGIQYGHRASADMAAAGQQAAIYDATDVVALRQTAQNVTEYEHLGFADCYITLLRRGPWVSDGVLPTYTSENFAPDMDMRPELWAKTFYTAINTGSATSRSDATYHDWIGHSSTVTLPAGNESLTAYGSGSEVAVAQIVLADTGAPPAAWDVTSKFEGNGDPISRAISAAGTTFTAGAELRVARGYLLQSAASIDGTGLTAWRANLAAPGTLSVATGTLKTDAAGDNNTDGFNERHGWHEVTAAGGGATFTLPVASGSRHMPAFRIHGFTPATGLRFTLNGSPAYLGVDYVVDTVASGVHVLQLLSTRTADTTVALTDAAPYAETEPPTFAGGAAIAVTSLTQTSYTGTCPVATDNTAVTGYQYRLNGGSWTTIGSGGRVVNITGRTPGATDTLDMRAFDAAGNYSSALTASVTLLTPVALTTEGFRNYAGTLLTGVTIPNVLVHKISDRSLVLSLADQVTHASTGVLSMTDDALVSGTAYMVTAFNADGTVRGAQRVVAA